MIYSPCCDDPNTTPEVLEEYYWLYFTWTSHSLHEGCIAIAKNPNISRALLAKASLHTTAVARNPTLQLLLLEDPAWVRRNINPHIIALALSHSQEPVCRN